MPDFPARGGASVGEIWGHATRALTALTGQPRTDLLGEDATFEAGTGARKARIDRIEAFDAAIEGTIVADGLEQNIILDETAGNPSRYLEGYVGLSPMQAGDTLIIRQYMSLVTGPTTYLKYAEETYLDAQTLFVLFITTKPAKYGLKLTLQQMAGVNRTYTYQLWRKRVA